jgi:hypothetical protein
MLIAWTSFAEKHSIGPERKRQRSSAQQKKSWSSDYSQLPQGTPLIIISVVIP